MYVMLFLLLVYMLCSKLFITLVNVIKGGCENKSAVYPFDISLNINKNESGGKSHIYIYIYIHIYKISK